jgi:hypothetical protein
MVSYSKAAMERAMKVQEVILRAMAKRITWWQAAEIIGISDRHMRRWRERYEEEGATAATNLQVNEGRGVRGVVSFPRAGCGKSASPMSGNRKQNQAKPD